MAAWPERSLAPTMPSVPTVPVQHPSSTSTEQQQGRAAGLLRRLSLGGALGKVCGHISIASDDSEMSSLRAIQPLVPSVPKAPSPPTSPMAGHGIERTANVSGAPQTPVSPTPRKARRASTLSPGSARPLRAPSPMGERILKGHFDGFN